MMIRVEYNFPGVSLHFVLLKLTCSIVIYLKLEIDMLYCNSSGRIIEIIWQRLCWNVVFHSPTDMRKYQRYVLKLKIDMLYCNSSGRVLV